MPVKKNLTRNKRRSRSRSRTKKQLHGGMDPTSLALILAAGAGVVYFIYQANAKLNRGLKIGEKKFDEGVLRIAKEAEDVIALQTAAAVDQMMDGMPVKGKSDKLRLRLTEINESKYLKPGDKINPREVRLECTGPDSLNPAMCFQKYITQLLSIIESNKLEGIKGKENSFIENLMTQGIDPGEVEKLLNKAKNKDPLRFGLDPTRKQKTRIKFASKTRGVKTKAATMKTKAATMKSRAATMKSKAKSKFKRGSNSDLPSSSSSLTGSKRRQRKHKKRKHSTKKK